jgi:hypothetical protein
MNYIIFCFYVIFKNKPTKIIRLLKKADVQIKRYKNAVN